MIIIETVNLNKIYSENQKLVNAISDCNIKIRKGECVVISGAKGSGKSTLLRMIGGYERPSKGAVYVNGNNITLYSDDRLALMHRREIGYLLTNNSLLPELTIHENIILPCLMAKRKWDESYYLELQQVLGITEILTQYPKQLNAAQQYCAAYARMLIGKPDIILIDEPEHEINHDLVFMDYLTDMAYQNNNTLIMVTNDPWISIYADHIISLNRGIVVEDKITQFTTA